jgi:anti-sigma factor RsiW
MTIGNDRLHELIQADLDGALSAAERAELARLLLQDPDARRLHGQLQRTDRLLRDIPADEPPAGLRDAVIAGSARRAWQRAAGTGSRRTASPLLSWAVSSSWASPIS